MLHINIHLRIEGMLHEICKNCFLKTIGESKTFLEVTMLKVRALVSGVTPVDSRGNSSPANKWSDEDLGKVRKHIDSVPTYESRYTRNDSKKKIFASSLYN